MSTRVARRGLIASAAIAVVASAALIPSIQAQAPRATAPTTAPVRLLSVEQLPASAAATVSRDSGASSTVEVTIGDRTRPIDLYTALALARRIARVPVTSAQAPLTLIVHPAPPGAQASVGNHERMARALLAVREAAPQSRHRYGEVRAIMLSEDGSVLPASRR